MIYFEGNVHVYEFKKQNNHNVPTSKKKIITYK